MKPDFVVIADGTAITPQIKDRLLSLTVTDNAMGSADTVEIELDDRGGMIELPRPGARLQVLMGYKGRLLFPMGTYIAREVTLEGPPDRMTIVGEAADIGGELKQQKTRSWDDMTIGDIVATIAGENGLEPKVSEALAPYRYDHLDQTDESDINFVMRIGRDHDALVNVKGEALLFIARGEGKTAAGVPLLPQVITRGQTTSHRVLRSTREYFPRVEASWHDRKKGRRSTEAAGQGTPVKKMRQTFATKEDAQRAAEAKLKEIEREGDTVEVTMPGNAALAAEGRLVLVGFRTGVDGVWSLTSVTHRLDGSGFTTSIGGELPNGTGQEEQEAV